MVDVLVILDGASEPVGEAATSLERARTPLLDRLAREGTLQRLQTVAPGLESGSETAIPSLLGWVPSGPVDRGAVEAAAHEVALPRGERAWRVDVLDANGGRATRSQTADVAVALGARLPDHAVRPLSGHRLLVTGPVPLPRTLGEPVRVWPAGVLPPRLLDTRTVMVAARGAAAGIARLMGAAVHVPPGATGQPDTDLGAKARAAVNALDAGAERVVVHVGGADEAAHEGDAAAKVGVLERVDTELLPPLVAAVERVGATLRVCPDHGCDPRTGRHDAHPVPSLTWHPGSRPGGRARRLTERDVLEVPV